MWSWDAYMDSHTLPWGFPGGAGGKESSCQWLNMHAHLVIQMVRCLKACVCPIERMIYFFSPPYSLTFELNKHGFRDNEVKLLVFLPIVWCIVNKPWSGKSSFVVYHRYTKWALPMGLHLRSKVGKFACWHRKYLSILGPSPLSHLPSTPPLPARLF